MTALLRVGTRGSALARVQTSQVVAALAAAHAELGAPDAIETVLIRTTGDRTQDRPLYELGGKGLFAKELEEALLENRIDIAMHSAKDLPALLPAELFIAACLPREDPSDAFLSAHAVHLADLPERATIGTSSPRRRAQILHQRPDLHIVPLRGNVDTRIRKLDAGGYDAAVQALAGLRRLGLADRVASILSFDEMLPAPAQGAIAMEIRAADERVANYVAAIDHAPTSICVATERTLVAILGGDCRTPIAALAQIEANALRFRAEILRPDGSARFAAARDGSPSEAIALASDAGHELLSRAGPGFFS